MNSILKNQDQTFVGDTNSKKEKHLKLIENKKNGESFFFYKVNNPDQLTKIGRSYLEDYKKGIKSFAFSSMSYKAAQQRTVLGLASYFDHLFDLKILIVSDSLQKGMFEELLISSKMEKDIVHHGKKMTIKSFHHHFDFLCFSSLLDLKKQTIVNHGHLAVMKALVDSYDVILWDTPIIDSSKRTEMIYSHIMGHLESVTLVVSPVITSSTDINEVRKYFSSYGVDIKGVIFDSTHKE